MTILIKNVQLVDGSGAAPNGNDIFISAERISAIGQFGGKKADVIIDGQGAYAWPGFIDAHTDSDHYCAILHDPGQEDLLKNGITTIIGGHCGSSLAPLVYGTTESLAKWGGVHATNIDWHSMGEFLVRLAGLDLGVNFATFAGHGTIRRSIVGEEVRPLTKNELGVVGALLARTIREGALGVSFGLTSVHSKPASYAELKNLAAITRENGGVVSMHLRDYEDEIAGAVNEAVRLARETKSRLLISHLRPNNRVSGAYSDIMKTIEEADDVFFDIAMSSSVLRELYTLLPEWAQNGGFTIMQENIKDPWFQKRMLKELPALNPATTLVVQAPNHDFLVGMTLESFANRIGVPPAEALLQLMQATKLYATLQIEDSRPEEMKPYLAHPRLIVGSNAAAMPKFFKPATFTHHDALRSFLKYPGLIDAPVEQAVHAMTGRPAGFFGLKERGLIKEGYFADIVLVRNQKVEWALVNGLVAIREGNMETGAASGKVLRCSGIL